MANLTTARACAARWGISEAAARRILAPLQNVDRDPATGAMRYDQAAADAARASQPGQGHRGDLTAAALRPDEAERLIADTSIPVAHRALWALLWDGHARLADALALDVADVDLEQRTARLRRPEMDTDPTAVPISGRAAELLRTVLGTRAAGPLLTTDGVRRLSRERAIRAAQAAGVSIHAFRHGGRSHRPDAGTPAEG